MAPRIFRLRWLILVTLILFLGTFQAVSPALADVAPPPPPFGSNPGGDNPNTMVQMVSEVVVFDIAETSPHPDGQARVTATFQMRNQGSQEEKMMVRFPLGPIISGDCFYSEYSLIDDLAAMVNGTFVATTTSSQTVSAPTGLVDIPCWANFPVTFPVGEDVTLQIQYTALGYGAPVDGFGGELLAAGGSILSGDIAYWYVLQTGAGWYGPIGKADVIFRLPYPVTDENVENLSYTPADPAWSASGNEYKWHKENFKPDPFGDLRVYLVNPTVWKNILTETSNTQTNPNDAEAWGRLGDAYKQAIWRVKGYWRDPPGMAMATLSEQAYQNALNLLPKNPDLNYGYADLICWMTLWDHMGDKIISSDWIPCVRQLKTVMDLRPGDADTVIILQEIARAFDNRVVVLNGTQPDYLILTPQPSPTIENTPTITAAATVTRENTPIAQVSSTATVPITQPSAIKPTAVLPSSDSTGHLEYGMIGLVGLAIILGIVFWVYKRTR